MFGGFELSLAIDVSCICLQIYFYVNISTIIFIYWHLQNNYFILCDLIRKIHYSTYNSSGI